MTGNTDEPSDGHFVEHPLSDLGNGSEEGLAGEFLRGRVRLAAVPEVAEHTRESVVVEPQQRLAVLGFLEGNSHSWSIAAAS